MNNENRLQTYNNTGSADRQDPRVKHLAVDVLRWLPYDPNDDQMLVIVALGSSWAVTREQAKPHSRAPSSRRCTSRARRVC